MEIRFYTPQMNLIGVMENQLSLQWRRRYYEPGQFELVAPVTDYNISLCKRGNLVHVTDAKEAGVIEAVRIEQNQFTNTINAQGRFLSSYLDRRITKGTMNYSGTVEGAMRKLLTDAVPIPLVELGTINNFPETISFQATYKNVLTYETKLSKSANIGYRLTPDFKNRKIVFETYKGVDHTDSQSERTRVVFSEDYGNLLSAKHEENDQLTKNVCYVGGRGEGTERVIVVTGNDTLTGLERREVFFNASDIDSNNLSDTQYREMLTTRGNEKLTASSLVTSFECTTAQNGNFKYRKDYDLGDTVTIIQKLWGVKVDLRITELLEIYEQGAETVTPTFGNPRPETIDWSDTNYG